MRAGMNEKKNIVVAHADGEKPLNCIHPPHWATTCVRPLSAMNLHHHSSSSIRLFSSEGEATLTNLLNNFLERIRREMAKCFGGSVLPSVGCAQNDNDVARFFAPRKLRQI